MPSLKDLRNRIASVKATQKITKAMQMVAAAKLRRAQERRGSGAPLRGAHGIAVLANITAGHRRRRRCPGAAGRHRQGCTSICWSSAPRERGLCGGFNSQIARLARDHIRRLLADGKQVKIICVGKKGFDILRRDYASMIIDRVDLREVKTLRFVNADAIAKKVLHALQRGWLRHLHAVLFAVQIGDQPDPDRAAGDPGRRGFGSSRGGGWRQRGLRV